MLCSAEYMTLHSNHVSTGTLHENSCNATHAIRLLRYLSCDETGGLHKCELRIKAAVWYIHANVMKKLHSSETFA